MERNALRLILENKIIDGRWEKGSNEETARIYGEANTTNLVRVQSVGWLDDWIM